MPPSSASSAPTQRLRPHRQGPHRRRDRRRRRRRRLSRREHARGQDRVSGSAGVLAGGSMRGGMIDIAGHAGERAGGVVVGEVFGMRGGRLVDRRQCRRAARRAHAARADHRPRRCWRLCRRAHDRRHHPDQGPRRPLGRLQPAPRHAGPRQGAEGLLADLRRLRRARFRVSAPARPAAQATDGRFKVGGYRARRLMGDMAVLGKGEMLILA